VNRLPRYRHPLRRSVNPRGAAIRNLLRREVASCKRRRAPARADPGAQTRRPGRPGGRPFRIRRPGIAHDGSGLIYRGDQSRTRWSPSSPASVRSSGRSATD